MTLSDVQKLQRIAERAEGHYHYAVMSAVDKDRCYGVNERARSDAFMLGHILGKSDAEIIDDIESERRKKHVRA
jgi:hypothetical protein